MALSKKQPVLFILAAIACISLICTLSACSFNNRAVQSKNASLKNNKEEEKMVAPDTNLRIFNAVKAIDLSIEDNNAANTGIIAEIGSKSGKRIDPGLFGVNMLFFTETDPVRADSTYQISVEYLNPSIMRFPGGTAGDNYLWKKKDIYTNEWYPNKTSPADMDTDEFLDFSAKYGAERIMVINYRSYVKMKDMDAFYKDAEDWVKYVNIEKKAGVKYWELGNELYFKENSEERTQFTPEQLAADYLELRKRLKAVDPDIKLGITLHKDWLGISKNVVENWNERVMKAVNCDVDFIILHIYSTPSAAGFETKGADIRDKVKELRKGIAEMGGRPDIPILMTEWNYGNESKVIDGQKAGHLVGMAQSFMEIIDAGFERATIWPMMNSDKRLVNQKDYRLTPAGEMFYWLNKELAGCEVLDVKQDKGRMNVELKAFLSPDGKQLRIMAVNRSQTREEQAAVSLKNYKSGKGVLYTLLPENHVKGSKVALQDSLMVFNRQQLDITGGISIKLPPVSVSIVEIGLE